MLGIGNNLDLSQLSNQQLDDAIRNHPEYESYISSLEERRNDLESTIGSFFRSGADIGTFGAAPKISAGLGTLGALATRPELFKEQSIPDVYSNAYDIAKQQQHESISKHPVASLLGGLGVLPGLIRGGIIPAEATATNLAKTGAMYGVGSSDYDSFGDLAKDVGTNAALNLLFGKAIENLPQALGLGKSTKLPQVDKNNFINKSIQDVRNKNNIPIAPILPSPEDARGNKGLYNKNLTTIGYEEAQNTLEKYGVILYPDDPSKIGLYSKNSNNKGPYKPSNAYWDNRPFNQERWDAHFKNLPEQTVERFIRKQREAGFMVQPTALNRNSTRSILTPQMEEKLQLDFRKNIPGSFEKLKGSLENRKYDDFQRLKINALEEYRTSYGEGNKRFKDLKTLISNKEANQNVGASLSRIGNDYQPSLLPQLIGVPKINKYDEFDDVLTTINDNNNTHINLRVDPSTLGNLKPDSTPIQNKKDKIAALPFAQQFKYEYSHNTNNYVPPESMLDKVDKGLQKLDLNDPNKAINIVTPLLTNRLVDKIAQVESGGNPNAKAQGSTASGLMQFTNSTWKDAVSKYGDETGITLKDKNNPEAQRKIAELSLRDNGENLTKFLNRSPQQTELYLTHFLGLNGAKSLLNAHPNQFAAKVLPEAAKANRSVFFKNGRPLTVSEVYSNLDKKIQKT